MSLSHLLLIISYRTHGASISLSTIACLAHIMSELVLTSPKFITQFIDCRGLSILFDLTFDFTSPVFLNGSQETLICILQISSHLARNSEVYYEILTKLFTANKLACILTQVSLHSPLFDFLKSIEHHLVEIARLLNDKFYYLN